MLSNFVLLEITNGECSETWIFQASLAVGKEGLSFESCNISTQKQHLGVLGCIGFMLPTQAHFINTKQSLQTFFVSTIETPCSSSSQVSTCSLLLTFRLKKSRCSNSHSVRLSWGWTTYTLFCFFFIFFVYLGRVSCSLELPILLCLPLHPDWELVWLLNSQL